MGARNALDDQISSIIDEGKQSNSAYLGWLINQRKPPRPGGGSGEVEVVHKEPETTKSETDLDRYTKLQEQEDKNLDSSKDERAEVEDYHQKGIDESEKENEEPEK